MSQLHISDGRKARYLDLSRAVEFHRNQKQNEISMDGSQYTNVNVDGNGQVTVASHVNVYSKINTCTYQP
jgi:hypothetical protein